MEISLITVVYKLNSDVRSNKYFESVAPKSKPTGNEKDGSSDDYEDKYGKDQEARSKDDEKYGQEDKYSKDEYNKEEEVTKPKYSDDQSSNYKTTTYSKEFSKPSTGTKYKFGYRYYGLNHQTGDNKKGDTMKLVTGKDGEESGDKSVHSYDGDHGRPNSADEEKVDEKGDEKADEKTDDKSTNEAEDSKDDGSESTKDDRPSNSTSYSSNANEENVSNEEDKVDEEFSGSRRYAKKKKRSITTSDYFRPYRTNSKMSGTLGRPNDKSIKMSSISRMNDKIMGNSCSYCNRRALKREDHLDPHMDPDFGDSEEEFVRPRNSRLESYKRAAALERRKRMRRPVTLERRKKIVSFDDPPDSYEKRNFDTAASFNEEDFDFGTNRRPSASRRRNREAFKSLKEEYDDAFGLKPSRSPARLPGLGFEAPRLERRKCNSNSARFKRTHRAYGGRDDTDFYSRLWRNPMYKNYQYLK